MTNMHGNRAMMMAAILGAAGMQSGFFSSPGISRDLYDDETTRGFGISTNFRRSKYQPHIGAKEQAKHARKMAKQATA